MCDEPGLQRTGPVPLAPDQGTASNRNLSNGCRIPLRLFVVVVKVGD